MSVCHREVEKLGQAICNKRHFEQTGFSLLTDRYRIGSLKVASPEITQGQQ
jgi:hypothetical protein